MNCPNCGSSVIGVVDSRPSNATSVWRRRRCTACQHKWNTIETNEAAPPIDMARELLTRFKSEMHVWIDGLNI